MAQEKHELTLVWANNISDEPEGEDSRDFYVCTCGWRSPQLHEGGQIAADNHG